jgi:hypothetical protein
MAHDFGPDFDPGAYLDATLTLHGLVLDEDRYQQVEAQFRLLADMARLIERQALEVDVEPANTFRP